MRLYIVRHGQTEWNAAHRAQGHTDIPLDQTGQAQALRLANLSILKGVPVITSDLQRAYDTAKAIQSNPKVDLRLRERGFGEWEGLEFTTIAENFAAAQREQSKPRHEIRPPGGESYAEVWERLKGFVGDQTHSAIIVTHGGIASLLTAILLNGTIEQASSFRFHNASITELEKFSPTLFRLNRYNDISHLTGLAVTSGVADGTSSK